MSDVWQLLRRAELKMQLGNYPAAAEVLINVLAADSDHALAHAYLAACLQKMLQPEAATREMRAAPRLAPEDSYIHCAAARLELLQGWYGAAERHLDKARQLAPDYPAVYRFLAFLYDETGRPERVLPTLQDGLNADPDSADVKTDIGLHFFAGGQIDAAEAVALEALQINPNHPDAHVLLARIRVHRRDYSGAREFAVSALQADPCRRDALSLLCALKLRQVPLLGRWHDCAAWAGRLHHEDKRELTRVAAVAIYFAVIALFAAGQAAMAAAVIATVALLLGGAWLADRLVARVFDRELKNLRLQRGF